jgi:hypothetical protein
MTSELEADLRQTIQVRMLLDEADREDVVQALRNITDDLEETEAIGL